MKPSAFAFILSAAAIASSSLLHAQDLRSVTEPVFPPVCITLKAAFTTAAATGGSIESRANSNAVLDTTRVQQALDHCAKSHAVPAERAASPPPWGPAAPSRHRETATAAPSRSGMARNSLPASRSY